MKIDFNNQLQLVTPQQNAEIVKMVSEGLINSKQAKELLTLVIEENKKQIIDYLKGN